MWLSYPIHRMLKDRDQVCFRSVPVSGSTVLHTDKGLSQYFWHLTKCFGLSDIMR